MTTQREVTKAARELRARLETMLEALPESDPSYMNVSLRDYQKLSWLKWRAGTSGKREAGPSREETEERTQIEGRGRSTVWGPAR